MKLSYVAMAMAVAIALCAATGALAAPKPGNFSISGIGASGWSLDCTLTKPNGESRVAVVGKSGAKGIIHRNGIGSVSCKTQAPPRGTVTFTLEKPFTCPYPKDDRGVCKWRMEDGQGNDFTATMPD